MKILAINPGSTSTKVAYYVDGTIIKEQSIVHPLETIENLVPLLNRWTSDGISY